MKKAKKPTKTSKKVSGIITGILRLLFILGVSFVILRPHLIQLSSSLMSELDLFDQTVGWIPRTFTLENFAVAWEHLEYPRHFLNSLTLTTSVSLMQLISCTIVAYGIARFEFRGSKIIFAMVIFTLVIPPQLIMIPLYLSFRFFNPLGIFDQGINLLNSYWPFALTSLTATGLKNGLFIYIMRQFFKNMPTDLEEAAYVDGAGVFKTFYRIMLPGAVPGLIIIFLFSFVWQWNDYFFITLYMGARGEFLTQALIGLSSSVVDHVSQVSGEYPSMIENTGVLLFITPLLILYLFMQRYFIESVERTGLVG